jgi:hypothetical protein
VSALVPSDVQGASTSTAVVEAAAVAAADEELRLVEAQTASTARGASTWLPRLGYELTRVRSELGEGTAQALVRLEQRLDQWIQNDVTGAVDGLPSLLLQELRSVQRTADEELVRRLDVVADQFLAGRAHELLPGGVRAVVAPPDIAVALVDVSQAHIDARTELFAGLGNFGSGRQSLSLVSTVATAASVPVALVGGVIGLGFWRMGRRSRQDTQARMQASRWLKAQVAEAGRVVRYRIDQQLNQAQLGLNLAVRDLYDRAGVEGRQAVEVARQRVVDARSAERERVDRAASRRSRAEELLERGGRLRGELLRDESHGDEPTRPAPVARIDERSR